MSPDQIAIGLAILAALIAIVALRADRPLAVAAAVIWRALFSFFVFARTWVRWLVLRLGGRRDHGPELMRHAFEDLGPTYIKLGQIIASSHGLFPEAYCKEFQKCLDRVRPFSFDVAINTVEDELPAPWSRHFTSIEEAPLASASIAQVHAAKMIDGREVVLKIQRPHIERRVDADTRILRIWAQIASFVPTFELANPVGIVDDFATTIREELDFRLEARNTDEFNRIMRELGHADVRAPTVIQEKTTRRMITMSRFYGVRVDDVEAIKSREVDAEERLIRGLHAWFQCMIFHGFFHGDVHAGNLMLLEDNALGFLDFGIIGRFPAKTRRLMIDYIVAFASGNYHDLGKVMLDMDAISHGVDLDALARDLERAYAPMLKLTFGEMNYGELLPNIMRAAARHRMRLPREFVLVTKQLLYFDRYAKLLAPKLNVFSDPRLIALVSADVLKMKMMEGKLA